MMVVTDEATDPAVPATTRRNEPAKLRLESVSYRYGQSMAVDSVDLEIEEGQFVSILGPSGCGKTTLLSMVAGLRLPTQGRILLDGVDITRSPPEKRPLGMVFQNFALFPHLSVIENVAFSLAVKRVRKSERIERARRTLSTVGLSGFEDRSVNQLSGGQQQRVALARSLVAEPEILLLDEPLGALDAAIRRDMQSELKALQRRLNITFIFVTHDQNEAMSMSDRIILMNDGHVEQDAAPFDLYTRPASPFAAAFVGDANFLKATLVSASDTQCVVAVGSSWQTDLPVEAPVGAVPGTAVEVCFRPEHVEVYTKEGEQPGTMAAVVTAQRYYGPEIVMDVDTAIGGLRVRQPAGPRLAGDLIGAQLWVRPDPRHIKLFPEVLAP